VHDIPAAACDANGGAGIDTCSYDTRDNEMIGNVVHHIGTPPCNRVQGLYYSHQGGRIVNNIAYANAGWGIHLWHAATDVTIANNLVFANGSGGIIVGAGDSPGGVVADNCVVSNNVVLDNPIGIYEYGATGSGNRYLQNLVFRNTTQTRLLTGTASGTLTVDPGLVDYRMDGSSDYHSAAGSPLIDSGTATGAPGYDHDEICRPQRAGFDRGPFELP